MIVFYDGHCAMCNRAVLFVLRRDQTARFSPLDGSLAKRVLPLGLPDTMVVQTLDGRILIRSDAWAYILRQLPAPWRAAGRLLSLIPRSLRDAVYRLAARLRKRLQSSNASCRLIPASLRNRFIH